MLRKVCFLSVMLFFCTFIFAQKGYEIQIQLHGVHDTTVVLGHHFGNSIYPDDTAKLDKLGRGVFKDKKKDLPGGMYVIYLPTKNYFDILINDERKFSIENDTIDLFHKIKFKNSKENEVFYGYQFFLSSKRDTLNKLGERFKKSKDEAEKAQIRKDMDAIDKLVAAEIVKINLENPNLFASKFIKATRNLDVPESPKGADGKIDSMFQYRYYRNNYFLNFDISDSRMLRTPLYENKIMTYIEKVVPQIPDSLYPEIDMLIKKSRTSEELFRYMLVTLFNFYGKSQIMGFDAVQIYIADKYYIPEATWSDSAYMKKLKDFVKKDKPLILDAPAPNTEFVVIPTSHFTDAMNDTALKRNPYVGEKIASLYNIKAQLKSEYLVIFFWDPDCGHCKKLAPSMHDVAKKLKLKGIQVLAVGTVFGDEAKIKWIDFINSHGFYEWVNAWNPYSYDYKLKYNIESTPQTFIIDKNNRIQAKRIGPEQVEEIIDMLIKKDEYLKNHSKEIKK